MQIPIGDWVLQYGMAGAVLIVVALFLKFLKDERVDRKAERESFVATINEVSGSLHALSLRIEHCPSNNNNGARKDTRL